MVKTGLRQRVVERDGSTCQECGSELVLDKYESGETAHVHHIKPKAEGGRDTASNLITLCRGCHREKHNHGVGDDNDDTRGAVLDVLQEGRATPGYIVDETELSRQTVHSQLNQLLAGECVRYVHEATGLYELVEDPREEHDESEQSE